MEIRAGKVIFSSSGGTAEKNSVSCKISLPTAWIKALGFDKDDREAELHFDGHTISICKKQTADSFIALHKQSGHTLRKYSFYDSNELCTVIYADHTDKTVFAENFTASKRRKRVPNMRFKNRGMGWIFHTGIWEEAISHVGRFLCIY